MYLYIKNMVCNRCIAAVKDLLDEQELPYNSVQLGEVELQEEPTEKQVYALRKRLEESGFQLLDDSRKKMIEQIKILIIEYIHYGKGDARFNLSEQLSAKLHKDYSYLSHLFSQVEGTTIEKYLINQKIEKAKELLVYNEATLSEIAFELGYSSVAHLSAQFKKITGLTPTYFKNMGGNRRKTLDKI